MPDFLFWRKNHKKNITADSQDTLQRIQFFHLGNNQDIILLFFSLIIHTSVRGQHLKIIFFVQCSGSTFAVSFLCQSSAFLSWQLLASLNEGQAFLQWKMLFPLGKKKTKPQNQQGGYNCTHHLQTDILQFLCGVSRIWWKVQFAHLGLMEEIELFFCRCMRNCGNKDPHIFGWTDTHRGHPSSVRTVSHLLDCLVPTISVLPGFYRTGTHWRRWGRLFAGADSGAPLSF